MKRRYELIEDGNGKFKIYERLISFTITEIDCIAVYDIEDEALREFNLLVEFKKQDEKVVRVIKEVEYDI